jgi:hypothetical protein
MTMIDALLRWLKPVSVHKSDAMLAEEQRHVSAGFGDFFDADHAEYLRGDYHRYLEEDYPRLLEQRRIRFDPRDYPAQERPGYALALTGDGIRSASFGIGVMQALNNEHLRAGNQPTVFSKLNYLSSVSGGGYSGCALTWYQRLYRFFPFGKVDTYTGPDSEEEENRTLSYIRLHGKYLTPHGLGLPGLLASVMMSVLHSTLVYTLLFSLLFYLPLLLLGYEGLREVLRPSAAHGVIQDIALLLQQRLGTEAMPFTRTEFSALFLILTWVCAGLFGAILLLYAASSFIPYWFSLAHGYRVAVQRWQGRLLLGGIAFLLLAGLPIVTHLLFGSTVSMADDGGSVSAMTGSGAVAVGLALHRLLRSDMRTSDGRLSVIVDKVLGAITVPVFISFVLAVAFYFAERLLEWETAAVASFAVGVLLLCCMVNIDQISPHKMYRDRLMETFLKTPGSAPASPLKQRSDAANRTRLSALATAPHWSPYPLINCNVILTNAVAPHYRARLGDSFLLSPLFCGSNVTGYIPTTGFERDLMTVPTAMAISGAAANPHAGNFGEGRSTENSVSFLMSFFGLRLGFWCFNPGSGLFGLSRLVRANYLLPGLGSLLGLHHSERNMFIELSDGGHFDNTGVYELIRRRVPVIFIADGGADPDETFDSLGNMIERCRVDFGTSIVFPDADYDLSGLIPGSMAASSLESARLYDEKYALAMRGYAVGDIVYPPVPGQGGFVGKVVYIKTCLTRGLPGDLYAYKSANPSYPNQPTLDQFFDERQFEAYRELGYQLTRQLLCDPVAMRKLP